MNPLVFLMQLFLFLCPLKTRKEKIVNVQNIFEQSFHTAYWYYVKTKLFDLMLHDFLD